MKKMFDRDYIDSEFEKIAKALKDNIHLYLLGGGAMSYYDLKTATKDADVVLRYKGELRSFLNSLEKCGYKNVEQNIHASQRTVYENEDGFTIDLFIRRISNGMILTDDMCSRAEDIFNLKNLTVSALSPEDIFILKSITSRKRDKDDMYVLFTHGLDFDIIKQEIEYQSKKLDDKAWLAFFLTGLNELKERYGMEIPYYDVFYDMACDEVLEYRTLSLLDNKEFTIEELLESIDDDEENIRRSIEALFSKGKIEKKGEKLTKVK